LGRTFVLEGHDGLEWLGRLDGLERKVEDVGGAHLAVLRIDDIGADHDLQPILLNVGERDLRTERQDAANVHRIEERNVIHREEPVQMPSISESAVRLHRNQQVSIPQSCTL